MKHFRIIPRLDLKNATVIKGIHFEGLRVVGDPVELAQRYAQEGADELLCMDAVASLYGRAPQPDVIAAIAAHLDIPLTAGGGIRSLEDARTLLHAGADKVALNTAAVRNPSLLSMIAAEYGSQCTVLSIEARRVSPEKWEVFMEAGREKTGMDVLEWAQHACSLGAGEILLTSVDREGTTGGYDLELIRAVTEAVTVPVIAHGGAAGPESIMHAWKAGADGAAAASIFHYAQWTPHTLKQALTALGVPALKDDGPPV